MFTSCVKDVHVELPPGDGLSSSATPGRQEAKGSSSPKNLTKEEWGREGLRNLFTSLFSRQEASGRLEGVSTNLGWGSQKTSPETSPRKDKLDGDDDGDIGYSAYSLDVQGPAEEKETEDPAFEDQRNFFMNPSRKSAPPAVRRVSPPTSPIIVVASRHGDVCPLPKISISAPTAPTQGGTTHLTPNHKQDKLEAGPAHGVHGVYGKAFLSSSPYSALEPPGTPSPDTMEGPDDDSDEATPVDGVNSVVESKASFVEEVGEEEGKEEEEKEEEKEEEAGSGGGSPLSRSDMFFAARSGSRSRSRSRSSSLEDYDLGKTIGEGGCSSVRLARDKGVGDDVAIKVTECGGRGLSGRQQGSDAYYREKEALAAIDHPNVIKIDAANDQDELRRGQRVHLLVLEFCSQGDLFNLFKRLRAFPDVLVRTYCHSLWSGLEACHSAQVYHRDIKPENILVADDWSLRIADFGLCSRERLSRLRLTGTAGYMAPEMFAPSTQGAADVEPGDIWSMGVVMFIMLTGNPPLKTANNRCWFYRAISNGQWDNFWTAHERHGPTLNPTVKTLLQRILDPEPRARPSAREVLDHDWFTYGPMLAETELSDFVSNLLKKEGGA